MKDSDIDKQITDLKREIVTRQLHITNVHRSLGKATLLTPTELTRPWEERIEHHREDIQVRQDKIAKLEEHKEFNAHLQHASKVVAGWPDWKQNVLRRQSGPQFVEHTGKAVNMPERYGYHTGVNVQELNDFVKRLDEGLAKCHEDVVLNQSAGLNLGKVVKPPVDKRKDLVQLNVENEEWRTYTWYCPETHKRSYHRIRRPAVLNFRPGGPTHRVTDMQGVTHCVPAPGVYGCVLTWRVGGTRPY